MKGSMVVILILFVGFLACASSGGDAAQDLKSEVRAPVLQEDPCVAARGVRAPSSISTTPSARIDKADVAPDFTLDGFQFSFPPDPTGKRRVQVICQELQDVSLSDFRGKLVFLNFWEDTCPPCRVEMPQMERLYKRYKDEGLVVLAVELGLIGSTQEVKDFAEDFEFTYPILLDDGDASRRYKIVSFPRTFLIDPEGHIAEGPIVGLRYNWDLDEGRNLIEQHLP